MGYTSIVKNNTSSISNVDTVIVFGDAHSINNADIVVVYGKVGNMNNTDLVQYRTRDAITDLQVEAIKAKAEAEYFQNNQDSGCSNGQQINAMARMHKEYEKKLKELEKQWLSEE